MKATQALEGPEKRSSPGPSSSGFSGRAGLARIAEAIRDDERVVLTVCTSETPMKGLAQTPFSLPRIVGAEGVLATLLPPLSSEEEAALRQGGELLQQVTGEVRL